MPRFLMISLAFLLTVPPAAAMTPPARSVQVSPGFAQHGLGTVTEDGLGVYLTTLRSVRDTRRMGTGDVDNPDNERNETTRTSLALDYRFSPSWSALVSIPYVDMEARFIDSTTGQTVTQETRGLADIGVFGRYSLWKNRLVAPTREWLVLAGVELGTGSTDEKDDQGVRLSATQQPGSGTADIILGTALTWGFPRASFYGDATYKKNGERAYQFGDVFAANAGLHVPFVGGKIAFLSELNGEFSQADHSDFTAAAAGRAANGTVLNTGADIVYFSPSLQWKPWPRWAFTAGVQVPVYQNFRGTQLKSDVNYVFGIYSRLGGTTR